MKKFATIGALALLLWFGVKQLNYMLASSETQIQWRLEEMIDGFNGTRKARVMNGFDLEFVDDSRGYTREQVGQALVYVFFNYIDRETKAFTMSASMPAEDLAITVHDTDPLSATVVARFLILDRGEEFWDLRLTGEMENDEDGWQFVRTTAINHESRLRER